MSEWPEGDVPSFSIDAESDGDRVVFFLRGELDLESAPVLRQRLHEAIDAGRVELTVDLAGLTFLESTGISVLVDALKLADRRGGRLVLRGPSPAVRRVLEITGLVEVFGLGS